jgi:hypothetical protein
MCTRAGMSLEMPTASRGNPEATITPDPITHRSQPHPAHNSIAFVQPLHAEAGATFRVDLIDTTATEAGIRAVIPVPVGALVVLSIALHPPMEGLFLSRVTHCTRLGNGRYHIGMRFLEQRAGNLNTTRVPEAWRKR